MVYLHQHLTMPTRTINKKYLIIAGVFILVILAIVGWTTKSPNPQGQTPIPSPSPVSAGTIPLAKVSTAPQREFATDNQNSYKIVYDPNYDYYIISVLGLPFDKIRLQAEKALIKKLNLSETAACAQVKVHIGAPYFANPDQVQTYDTFSFCTN